MVQILRKIAELLKALVHNEFFVRIQGEQLTEEQWKKLGEENAAKQAELAKQREEQWKKIGEQNAAKQAELAKQREEQWKKIGEENAAKHEEWKKEQQKKWDEFGKQTQQKLEDLKVQYYNNVKNLTPEQTEGIKNVFRAWTDMSPAQADKAIADINGNPNLRPQDKANMTKWVNDMRNLSPQQREWLHGTINNYDVKGNWLKGLNQQYGWENGPPEHTMPAESTEKQS
jgi:hypothetical protein